MNPKYTEFNEHYKIVFGDLILKEIDEATLRELAARALSYININCLYDDYLDYSNNLRKHLIDQDIRIKACSKREKKNEC